MRTLTILSLLCFGLSAFAALNPVCPLPAKKINVEMKDAPVIDLLNLVFKEAGVKNEIADNPVLHKKISMQVREADICDVFNFAMTEAKLSYKIHVEATK